jgi:hypothetical protein
VRKTAFAVYRTVALPRADRVRSLLPAGADVFALASAAYVTGCP